MTQRINFFTKSPDLAKKLTELSMATGSSLESTLIDLVQIRASLLNGCTFCLDMHVKEAKIHGERELRVYHVPVWRESKLFTDKERAALEWTELLTKISERGVSDADFEKVRTHFSEKEVSDLTYVIGTINFWNRLNIGLGAIPGAFDAAFGLTKAGLA